ncbi:MAG: type I methionyl aminopeptidase [Lentisphaeria bacterium]
MGKTKQKNVRIHTPAEIDGIRIAAAKAAWVRETLLRQLRPGMSTLDIDNLGAELIGQTGGTPAFHGYHGFPGRICVSLNEVVVHGIGNPGRIVQVGDLVSVDIGVCYNGFIGDTAASTFIVAPRNDEAARLLEATKASLDAGIKAARNGNRVSDIGAAVEKVIKEASFEVVRDFVGHGCGCELHEPPEVPNFKTGRRGPVLEAGMVLAIEPMVNAGTGKVTVDGEDGWTVRAADNRLSAHMEHMVFINNEETEVLTWPTKQ